MVEHPLRLRLNLNLSIFPTTQSYYDLLYFQLDQMSYDQNHVRMLNQPLLFFLSFGGWARAYCYSCLNFWVFFVLFQVLVTQCYFNLHYRSCHSNATEKFLNKDKSHHLRHSCNLVVHINFDFNLQSLGSCFNFGKLVSYLSSHTSVHCMFKAYYYLHL